MNAGTDTRRRVLFVAWFLNPRRRWLAEYLDPTRYECDYVGLPQRVDITRKHTGLIQWFKHFMLALKARWRLLWRRYDLIVSAFPQVGFALGLVNRFTFERTPHVIWYFNCGHEYRGARRFLSRIAYARVNRFIVYSRHEREVYSKVFALPKERFHFTFLTGAPLEREDYIGARERYGLAPHYIASMGSSSRDYDTLFKATDGLDVQIVVVTHPYALEGLKIPPWVKVLESIPQQDYLGVIAEAGICVIPVSNIDTASGQMTLIQAMSLGVPVIATRCIGTEDYVRDGETGRFVDMGDVKGMRKAIRELVENPEVRAAMAARTQDFAREHFFDYAGSRALHAVFDELEQAGELPSLDLRQR
jgi:glycosyltransferase involved in cell wall biosynthesis